MRRNYKILSRQDFSPTVHLIEVEAPYVARKAKAGQFVVVMTDERGERIPLTIADWDKNNGSIALVFLEIGTSTRKLAQLKVGDHLYSLSGPLGNPTHIDHFGTVVCVGGGVGIAAIFPIARALKLAGNKVITIMGARTKELLFWEEQLREVSNELIVTTDDGSYGRKGVVTMPLKEVLERGEKIDLVVAVGPAIMMKFCALTTKPFGVRTIASLNSIMVDGSGMCGACRVSVGGQTKFTCIDGPEFDAHQVDWELLLTRLRAYQEEERLSLEHLLISAK